jgi:hypothetical protein
MAREQEIRWVSWKNVLAERVDEQVADQSSPFGSTEDAPTAIDESEYAANV